MHDRPPIRRLRMWLLLGLLAALFLLVVYALLNTTTDLRIDRESGEAQATFRFGERRCIKVMSDEFPFLLFRCDDAPSP